MSGGILAVRQDSLGDVLLAGPAIRALAAGFGRPVDLLCGPRGAAAAEILPGVDRVLCHLAGWIDPEPPAVSRAGCERLIEAVKAIAPKEAVIFTSFHQSALPTALLLRLAGVERIAAISHDYPGSLLDIRHRPSDGMHEVERALSLAAAAGYRLPPGDDGHLRVLTGVTPAELPEEPFVAVHPGASVTARAWEADAWRRLVAKLGKRGVRVAVSGGSGEEALTAFVTDGTAGAVDYGGRLSLGQLAALLERASVVAVANTGPAHLAAAVGTPVASLYAPTVPAVCWRPWRVPHRLLHAAVPCAGCRAVTCPVPGHPCLAGVAVDRVLEAIDELRQTGHAGGESPAQIAASRSQVPV